ncbi:hypothetical protein HED60_18455 [Planctomycetales bacterium ZRK34]|nr:hypothetical protein HED60_18455 [Planctomycetales bacterium ZRK34]
MSWQHTERPSFGLTNKLSTSIATILAKSNTPNLRNSPTLMCISDYSGEHPTGRWNIASFLLLNPDKCIDWEYARQHLRSKWFRDGRRMSYKKLNDIQRRRALLDFLIAADQIDGVCVTFAVDKSIETLFTEDSSMDEFPHLSWPNHIFERAMRIIHFASFLIAGLSAEHQNLIWITDEDAIAANHDRLREFVDISKPVLSNYLSHTLGHVRIGTTELDSGDRSIEDLAAIPDLVAGFLSECLTEMLSDQLMPVRGVISPIPRGVVQKAKNLAAWYANPNSRMTRKLCAITPAPSGQGLLTSWIQFHAFI